MARFQAIALWLIAGVLLADFAVDHIKPYVVLQLNEKRYFDSARRCHEALSNRQQLQDNAGQYDQPTLLALYQSASVAIMDCFTLRQLGEYLRANGVSKHDLNQIDLSARNASHASLHYFTQSLAKKE